MQISPLGGWLVSALNPLLTLSLTTILHKQASRPLHVHTTMQLPSKITVFKCTRPNTFLWNKIKKNGISHQILKKKFSKAHITILLACKDELVSYAKSKVWIYFLSWKLPISVLQFFAKIPVPYLWRTLTWLFKVTSDFWKILAYSPKRTKYRNVLTKF
jgi:hypothetical protein